MKPKQTGITNHTLPDLTTDCLRFTLRFFRPIQMSPQHIYHTALPLSPTTSLLRFWFLKHNPSWKKNQTTLQISSSETPTGWGGLFLAIKAESETFACMSVAGQEILAVDGGNIISIFDVVTGVLRLTLKSPQPVTKVVGFPDGPVLFCSHRHPDVITMWDTQTGGLIYTFRTNFEISDIAISSRGKFLATCSLDGTFRFWKVEGRSEDSRTFDKPVAHICFLDSEDQVALALEGNILVLEMTTGKTLRTLSVFYGSEHVTGMAFSTSKRRLAIRSTYDRIVVIDTRSGFTFSSSPALPLDHVSAFAVSDAGDQIFCATEEGNLIWFDTSIHPPEWVHLQDGLGVIHSIDPLGHGRLAVNLGDSIQILATRQARSPESLEQRISSVYLLTLRDGKAICTSSWEPLDIYVLDMETMETLSHHAIEFDYHTPFPPRPLCASFDQNTTVIFSLRNGRGHIVQLVSLEGPRLIWEAPVSQDAVMGALSPDGGKVIIVVKSGSLDGDGDWELCVREMTGGKLLSSISQAGEPPSKVEFVSETQFYTEHLRVRESSIPSPEPESKVDFKGGSGGISPAKPKVRCQDRHLDCNIRTTFTLTDACNGCNIQKVSKEEILRVRPYALDENLEWVVDARSRRVCWLPPGHVTGRENGHVFIGASLFTAGQDGIVRKLTFREPCSE
jgi:WD40 repeat protein